MWQNVPNKLNKRLPDTLSHKLLDISVYANLGKIEIDKNLDMATSTALDRDNSI